MDTGERFRRRCDAVAVVGLVAWLLVDLTGRALFGSVPWPQSVVDYRILYDASRHVVGTHTYPTDNPYPYPPPAVAAHAATAVLPFAASAAVWMVLTGLAAVACYALPALALGLHRRPGGLVLLPLAHAVAAYYFQWDLRSLNCNLVVLAVLSGGCLALARGRDAAAGTLFALAVALKVMPVLVLPYLAWTRRWRALAAAVAASAVLWAAVPVATFGGEGAARVYRGWADELAKTTDDQLKFHHPIMISLDKAARHLTGTPGGARVLVGAVCGLWVLVGLAGAAASVGRPTRDGGTVLAHASLLVLGPVAVNPYLEPYHLVPLALPALVLLATVADEGRSRGARAFAAAAFALGVAILKWSSPWPVRGLLVNAQALVLCAAAVAVTWPRGRGGASG